MEKRWPGKHTLLAANFSMDDSLMRKEVGNLSKTYKVKGPYKTQVVGILRKCCSYGLPINGGVWTLSCSSLLQNLRATFSTHNPLFLFQNKVTAVWG